MCLLLVLVLALLSLNLYCFVANIFKKYRIRTNLHLYDTNNSLTIEVVVINEDDELLDDEDDG